MLPRPSIAIALSLGLAAILAPVLASIYLAWHESLTTEKTLSVAYAQNVLSRVEETARQFAAGVKIVQQDGFLPCSRQDIETMRQIDLGSSYIQAAGRISGDTILCTSQGTRQPIALGKPSLTTDRGVAEYFNVKLSPQQWHPLNVFAANGFAILVDPSLAVDIPTEGLDVELAVFVPSARNHERISAVGKSLHSEWFEPIPKNAQRTFLSDGFLVTEVRSESWDLAVVAATPIRYVYRRVWRFGFVFTPIGILCGALLAWAVNYLTRARSSFPAKVRRAARNREFFVEYQPIVELTSRRIVAAEALVRWKSRLEIIRPDHFIPLAEELDLIHIITECVLELVAADLPKLLKLDPDFQVGVNMSASDLRSGRTMELLDKLLDVTAARPANIEVEATERAFLQGPETAKLIGRLSQAGFSVAIDDFGTGYSSLACLQSLSLDTLKIDKAFVDTINTDGATSEVVRHIIEMAHSLNLHMVAEGVETAAQAQYLENHGVQYAQGWHFGKPMPIASLLEKLEIRKGVPKEAWV